MTIPPTVKYQDRFLKAYREARGTKKVVWKRVESNRRHSADLAAIYQDLPYLCNLWLKIRKEDPETASSELMGLSNELENKDEAKEIIQNVKRYLRIRLERP